VIQSFSSDMIGGAIVLGIVAIVLFFALLKANLVICQPSEVVIISGRRRRLADGTSVGYRVLKGGRGFKLPVIESVRRLPLNTLPIEFRLQKALTKGIIPINVDGLANVKIAGSESEGLGNAIERFLGKNLNDVAQVARETIEGALRGALANVTPDEANGQRSEVAAQTTTQARVDLHKLGIVVDFVTIKNISDDQGYLEAIGRKKTAEVLRNARIAEATADAEARVVSAEQKMKGSVAEAQAEQTISDAENKLRVLRANLAAEGNRADEKAKVAGQIARVEEEMRYQAQRVELNRSKEQADTVVPAEAQKMALEMRAQGAAAQILEDGKATAEAVRLMQQQWQRGDTKDLFMIRMLPELLDKVTKVVADNLHIEKLTVLDSGNGNGIASHVKSVTSSALMILEQLKNATGLDVPGLLSQKQRHGEERQMPTELR
jgi:flotillin